MTNRAEQNWPEDSFIELPSETRLFIGNNPDPKLREQIVVSDADLAKIPPRGQRGSATVLDLISGQTVTIRHASCGIRRCLCALEFV